MREAKMENTRCGLRPMSDKAAGQKTRSPKGCDENGLVAALLLSHVSIEICSFVAPCRRPILIATPLYQSRTWCTRNLRSLQFRKWVLADSFLAQFDDALGILRSDECLAGTNYLICRHKSVTAIVGGQHHRQVFLLIDGKLDLLLVDCLQDRWRQVERR